MAVGVSTRPGDIKGKDRLIVALDVSTAQEAMEVVDKLDNVSFFKVGWQLFLAANMFEILRKLHEKNVFGDLKIPGDIGNTIRSVVSVCLDQNVKFLTLSESVPAAMIQAAKTAKQENEYPRLLTVPFLSSLDAKDLPQVAPGETNLDDYILRRAQNALDAGCDGLIASGREIKLCREKFPSRLIVSPGIRLAGASSDDHKRHTTPSEAIRFGADYLVVGRPILRASDPRAGADRIIAEIDEALDQRKASDLDIKRSTVQPASRRDLQFPLPSQA